MTVIINPGSGAVPSSGEGWTNTAAGARREAEEWLRRMTAAGIRDVELLDEVGDVVEGRWGFGFRHAVSGVVVDLVTHGLDDWKAYERERIFCPRVYWNGSSTGEPQIEDWLAPGFEVVKTLRKADES